MYRYPMARLTALSRESLIPRHLEDGEALMDLASQAGISLRAADKWLARFRTGGFPRLSMRLCGLLAAG